MNVKMFTHTDLDGVGARIALQFDRTWFAEEGDTDEYEHLENAIANERIIEFVNNGEYKGYDEIYVTDLPLEPAAMMKLVEIADSVKIFFIDHHPTTLEKLTEEEINTIKNSYSVFMAAKRSDEPTSATLLTSLHLSMDEGRDFILDINDYDTWNWSRNGNTRAKKLNDLLYLIGIEKFVESAIETLDKMDDVTTGMIDKYALVLDLEETKINNYIEKKNKEKIIVEIDGKKAAVVSSEQYQSQLGHGLLNLNSDIDIVIMINAGKNVSLRSREGVDVSSIAKKYNGGGHPQASGFSVPDDTLLNLFNEVFK